MKPDSINNSETRPERAVLVGLIRPGEAHMGTRYDPLAELAALTESAGATVVGRLVQRRSAICAKTYIGSGKTRELADYAEEKQADVLVFDNDLTPSQIREIDKLTKRRVIDRTELILDIFAARAQTHAARLQVELAQLEYTAPRLRGMWTHLERIAGAGGGTGVGAVGGVGTRGPGERQIEIDRRIVQKRVSFLREQLKKIDLRKLREVRSRRDYFTVALVGYTNAGKSTLMNALTGTETLVEDKPFATLDTLTRRWELGGGQTALLSDTVGFVRDLPHQLVASFRATLEETIHADLLLHVIDASDPNADAHVQAVAAVLLELGCEKIPQLNVLNKIDAVDQYSALHILRARLAAPVEIAAKSGQGLETLRRRVIEQMQQRYVTVTIETPAANGKLYAYVRRQGELLSERFDDGAMFLGLRLPAEEVQRVVELGGRVVDA